MNARTRILAFIVGALLGPLAVAAGPSSDASRPVKQSGAALPHSAPGGSLRKVFLGHRIDDYHFARYVVDWAAKVERVGTLNFPRGAEGKLYGNLLVIVEIGADGELLDVAIRRSSGSTELDDATMRIIRLAAPYAPFTPEMRRETDVIVVARTFSFFNRDAPLPPSPTTSDSSPPEAAIQAEEARLRFLEREQARLRAIMNERTYSLAKAQSSSPLSEALLPNPDLGDDRESLSRRDHASQEPTFRTQRNTTVNRQARGDRKALEWADQIIRKIRSNMRTPAGTSPDTRVVLSVGQLRSGEVMTVAILQESDSPEFDTAMMEAVKASSPLPLPLDMSQFRRELIVTLRP